MAANQDRWTDAHNGCVVTEDGELVVSVPRPKGTGASAKRDARVKLISAAPDLAGALAEAVEYCAAIHGESGNVNHECGTCKPWRGALRKAGRLQ